MNATKKHRESEKHKKMEKEQQTQAGKGNTEGGGRNPERSPGKSNPGGGRRSSAPPTGRRGPPNPATPKREQGEKLAAPPSTPSAGGAKKGETAKKRKLNWHFKCLQAVGVEVKFPEERYGGGSEEEDVVFWITVKIGHQVYKAVLDTGATRSILACGSLSTHGYIDAARGMDGFAIPHAYGHGFCFPPCTAQCWTPRPLTLLWAQISCAVTPR